MDNSKRRTDKASLFQAGFEAGLASAKEQAERLADALVELKGQVEQARDGFDRWPYNNSPSMKHSLTGAAKALAAWEKSRG